MEKIHNISELRDESSPFYLNRELSWLEFNFRVLSEAMDPTTPLLERVKFISIFSKNLDEFFMVRVAGLKRMLKEGITRCVSPDNMLITDVLDQISKRVTQFIALLYQHLDQDIVPRLRQNGIVFSSYDELNHLQKTYLNDYFYRQLFPVLTPLAVDPSHPFPYLTNNALHIVIAFSPHDSAPKSEAVEYGFVEIPARLPRFIQVADDEYPFRYVLIENIIYANMHKLFPSEKITAQFPVRVSRSTDYTILESEIDDLRKFVQKEVLNRDNQQAVRLTVSHQMGKALLKEISRHLKVSEQDIYRIPGPLNLGDLDRLHDIPLPNLKEQPFNPRLPRSMAGTESIFTTLKHEDILVHHPYDSFYIVTDFLNRAAHDDHVLAIKQTLYRTSGDSPIIEELINAANNGKKVTAVVELKARFDEKNNIIWARRLEHAGVNVVFGFVGLKTHAKATIVVRQEGDLLKRYVHMSTGNYNSVTANRYTDLGFFTSRDDIGEDISLFFNLLTGFNVHSIRDRSINLESIPKFKKIIVGPMFIRQRFRDLILQEIAFQKKHGNGAIFAKMNALIDKEIIDLLYEASQAGVKIKLMVRGICGLIPGLPGRSENIEVRSVIDRFLEHSRIYQFHANGARIVYLGSADMMTRNMDHRIEILFPVESEALKDRLIDEILCISWADNVKARKLLPNGSYEKILTPAEGAPPIRSQERFIEIARSDGVKSIPYDEAVHFDHLLNKRKHPIAKNRS